jgi:hypothetical protein
MKYSDAVRHARILRSENGEQPMWDNALVALVERIWPVTAHVGRSARDEILGDRPTFSDPPHHKDDVPCHWCGGEWQPDTAATVVRSTPRRGEVRRMGSMRMTHAVNCEFLHWQDVEADHS